MTDAVIKTILEHQQVVRTLLEAVVDDVRQWRGLDRELVALEARIKVLESSLETALRDSHECQKSVQSRLNGLSNQISQDRISAVEAKARNKDELRHDLKLIEEKIHTLERDAAVVAGKYGLIASALAFLAMEAFRWILHKSAN